MGISFGSINTGLPKDIVKQIIEAEKIPLQKMEKRKAKIENKKSLLADLKQRVENLRGKVFGNKGERSFREFAIDISDESVLGATVDKNIARPGSYQIEVSQLARKSSAISNGVEDKDKTYTGVGYIQYILPDGEEKEIYVDTEHANLTGIAKLINSDVDNGMHATVVNAGDESDEPWKIIIAVEGTGDGKRATWPALYLVDGEVDIYFDQHRDAQDAKVKLDGFEIELPENKTADLIPGLTLDLKQAKPGREITLEIKEDTAKMAEKLSTLVENINNVLKFIKEQNALDESVDTSQTLGGDLTLQTLETRIRNAVFQYVDTEKGPGRIGDVGLTFQRNGLLQFDTEKFQAKLDSEYKKTVQVVVGRYSVEDGKTNGFIDNIETVVNGALKRPSGVLTTREQGLKSQIEQIDRRVASRQRQLARKEENLKKRFARLEETISRIRSQGNGLAGLGGGSQQDLIQQLG